MMKIIIHITPLIYGIEDLVQGIEIRFENKHLTRGNFSCKLFYYFLLCTIQES